jgi:hypothetical protein
VHSGIQVTDSDASNAAPAQRGYPATRTYTHNLLKPGG